MEDLVEAPALRVQVYERLRDAILSGELAPGARISPVDVARRFEVSTMPVRDALQLLEREGLVETSARRWTRVVDLEPALVVELVPIVALLEQHALAIAPMPSPEATASLRAANDRFASSIERADVAGVIAADAEFHAGIIALAANRSLERAIRDAGTRLRLLRARVVRPELARASIEDHDRIVDRLEHGDRAGAVRAVGDNWERGLARFRHEGVRLSRLRM